ncbi:1-phosphofructokinase family hexose kinase [Terrimonas alba]|uniref:1-phosphofructokinase family hexose kinase n=1 Tax=Terrimonas alba TaxID=3349636 RepID=UPI0035F4FBB4
MTSIITITFSPCIDKSTSVHSLIPEKKLKCSTPKLEPGGGGINVARAIKKLGGEATAIFPSGGYTGKFLNHLIEKENILSIIIETANETRENIIVVDQSTNNQYRFGMPGTTLTESEWQHSVKAVEEACNGGYLVASGSLPPGVPTDIYSRLAKIAHNKNAKFIVDASGDALKYAVKEGVYLLKPNLGELSSLAGLKWIDADKAEEVARHVIDKFHCEIIVVSMGADGAMLVTAKDSFRMKTPKVERKSTVGAGDSMVAGIVFSLNNGKNLKNALAYGIACGTAATLNPGTELCKKDDADRLYLQINQSS